MSSEEEKKAIEFFEKRKNICLENANICDENDYDGEAEYLREEKMYIDTVLNIIAKLQKENKELKQENKRIKYFSSNLFIDDYIPKQVVKDKIKEIEEDKESYYYYWFLEERDIEKTINILQELLEGDKNG